MKLITTNTLIFMCWGMGSAGMATMNLSRTLILRFMTDYLDIAATAAGLIFAFSKIYDAITDPLMGRIADHHSLRSNNFALFILLGAITCPVAYLLVFNVPAFSSSLLTLCYMLFTLLFFATTYTIFSVPYLSMSVDLAEHYHQRNFLLSFRAIGIAVGGLIGGLLAPLLLFKYGRTQAGHESMSLVIAPFILIFLLFAYLASRQSVPKTISAPDQTSFKFKLGLLKNNPHFCVLICSKFVFFTGVSVLSASGAYFTQYVLGRSDRFIALFYLCFFVCVILFQPVWLKLGRTFAKHTLFVSFCLALACINLTWLLSSPEESIALFIFRASLIGACFGGIIVMGQSMLPDTIDYDMKMSGINRKCLLAGIFSFAEKSSTALGIALVGLVLGLCGYMESSNSETIIQPTSAIRAIYLCFSVLPAVFMLASALLMKRYSLSENHLAEIQTRVSNQAG